MNQYNLVYILMLCISFNGKITFSQMFLGRPCTSGGYANNVGECKLLTDCPSAKSDFRAGLNPTLCYQENETPLICCQTEKRISARKCEEYSKQIFEQQIKSSIPGFVPFYTGNDNYDESPRYGNRAPIGSCNNSNPLPYISGGRPADRHEMPFAVALKYDDVGKGGPWKCAGTLISEQFVLTAAHCLDNKASKPPTYVLLGDKHLQKLPFSSSHRIEARIEKIYVHPEYKQSFKYHDIGLIKLDRKIKFNRMVHPACLPQPEQRPETLGELFIAGWGSKEAFGTQADVLQIVNITRYNVKECKSFEGTPELPNGILKSQICAGDIEENKDTCKGDSGGPLVSKQDKTTCTQTIIGLTSFGDTLCGYQTPAIYTNVQSYLDWIESQVWENLETSF